MKIYLVCDFRENFTSYIKDTDIQYNDHPKKDSIIEIKDIISKLGYDCEIFGGIPELIHAYDLKFTFEKELFFNFTDGLSQSYSRVQAPILFELLNVNYSGANPFAAAIINNKYYTKLAIKDLSILTPNALLLNDYTNYSRFDIEQIGYPLIVKPNTEGSSLGITQNSVCFNYEQTKTQINKQMKEFNELILEKYIQGYDVTNLLIGNNNDFTINEVIVTESHGKLIQDVEVLGMEEKAYKKRILHMGEDILSHEVLESIKNISILIKNHLKANDIIRIDYRVTPEGDIYFLEANSMPRISSTSEAGFICKYRNITFSEFIDRYLSSILQRESRKSRT